MNRRIQLWLGVSALALMGLVSLPPVAIAGNAQDNDLDPDGGMRNECGEPGGCAEAGESFESQTPGELGEDGDASTFAPTAKPRSHGGGLSDGDSVSGRVKGGGSLGGSSGGLGD